MNELVPDLDPRYVPVKFDRNQKRIAPGRAVTGLARQNNWLARYAIIQQAMSPMKELVQDLDPSTSLLSLTAIWEELYPGER